MQNHEYTFDVKLFALIRVQAQNKEGANGFVKRFLENAKVVCTHENAAILQTSLALDDEESIQLIEIDGELAD